LIRGSVEPRAHPAQDRCMENERYWRIFMIYRERFAHRLSRDIRVMYDDTRTLTRSVFARFGDMALVSRRERLRIPTAAPSDGWNDNLEPSCRLFFRLIPPLTSLLLDQPTVISCRFESNTHRQCRRDATVELSRVGDSASSVCIGHYRGKRKGGRGTERMEREGKKM